MPQIITKDGKRIEVSEEQIKQALSSGQWWGFKEAPQIAVVDPKSGNVYGKEFTPQAMQDVFGQGHRLETPEEETQRFRSEKYGTGVGSALAAAGLGLARGATLGLSDVALGAGGTVDPREIRALEEERPGISLATEITGVVIPGLLAPEAGAAKLAGEGAVATGAKLGVKTAAKGALAKSPTALLGRGTHALEKAVAKKLGGGKGAQLLGSMAGTGAEGAAFSFGSAVSNSVIEDKPLWSEATMSEVGLGGLIGMGLGGSLKGLGILTGKAQDSLARKTFERKMKSDPGLYEKVAAMATGVEPEKIAQFTRGAAARANREIAMKADDDVVRLAREYADEYTKLQNSFDRVSINHRELKSDQMKFKVRIGNEEETKAAVRKLIGEGGDDVAEGEIHNMLRLMRTKEGKALYGFQGDIKEALTRVKTAYKAVVEAESKAAPGELSASLNNRLFMELDNLKKDMGKLRKKMGRVSMPRGKDFDAMDRFESAYDKLKTTLEDEKLWGDAAIAQKEINAPFSDWLSVEDAKVRGKLKYKMARQTESRDWQAVYKGDAGEAQRFLSEINAPKSDLDLEHYVTSLERQDKLIQAHQKHYNLGEADAAAEEARRAIKRMQEIQKDASKITRLRDDLKEIHAKGLQGGVMGGLGGYALGGLPGAVIGAGITQPGKVIEAKAVMDRFQGLRKLQDSAKKNIDSGIKAFMKPTKKTGRTLAVATAQKTESQKRAEFRRAKQSLDEIAANPVTIQDKIHNRIGELAKYDPELLDHLGITASRAVEYLIANLPPQMDAMLPGVIDPDPGDIPDYELDRFNQRLETVNDPMSALRDMATGELTMEQVETLQAVYPALYAHMQQRAIELVADDPGALDYSKKAHLSALLQIPLDPSMTPDGVMGLQARSGLAAKQDAQRAQNGGIAKANKLTLADDEQSSSDRIQAKK